MKQHFENLTYHVAIAACLLYSHCLFALDDTIDIPMTAGHNAIASFTSIDGSTTNGILAIKYLDGFGYEEETVMVGFTPNRKDLVTYKEYDLEGRLYRQWLPGASLTSGGNYNADYETLAITTNRDNEPYSFIEYEPSPLDRISKQYGEGYDWHSHEKNTQSTYLVNKTNNSLLNCRKYIVNGSSENSLSVVVTDNYPSGALQVVQFVDEDDRRTLEFKDTRGNLVLSRKEISENVYADTYYVYDGIGKLLAVLPPELVEQSSNSGSISSTLLSQYAYLYLYDNYERLKSKKLPGADWIRYAYDDADRIILEQNGSQRQRNELTFHIYDVFGRECLMGIANGSINDNSSTSSVTKCTFTGQNNEWMGYSIEGLTLSNPHLCNVAYYDNYQFVSLFPSNVLPNSSLYYGMEAEDVTGKLTGKITARLDTTITENYLYTIMRYDERGRLAHTETTNLYGGYGIEDLSINHIGLPVEKRLLFYAAYKPEIIEHYTYEYDHAARLETIKYKLGNTQEIILRHNEYNDLGELVSVTRTLSDDATTFDYNVRGWLIKIEHPKFSEYIYYNTSHNNNTTQYSGNVSTTEWKAGSNLLRGFKYSYDKLNRLTSAVYGEGTNLNSNTDRYNEVFQYDKMGNVESISRYGLRDNNIYGLIDNLNYTYNGNQVIKIDDAVSGPNYTGAFHFVDGSNESVEYEYDENGNMTKDLNRKISSIQYNLLNLPSMITTNDGKTYTFTYDATGKKLIAKLNLAGAGQIVQDSIPGIDLPTPPPFIGPLIHGMGNTTNSIIENGGTLDPTLIPQQQNDPLVQKYGYCGNILYHNNDISKILNPEGYVTFDNSNNPVFHYFIKDHLGSVRVVFDGNNSIEQVNHYYAFGGLMGESTGGSTQWYKYNGKELDRMNGLDWYDYGARYYDAMRFTTMDPMTEKYYSVSPYAYCANNPIIFIDENGLFPKGVLVPHKTSFYRADYYTFTKPAAHLLSLVTGVKERYIRSVNVMEKGLGREYPMYDPCSGGGGITIGSNPYNVTMTFTKNYFADDATEYDGNGYGQNVVEWLEIISHEATHINHVEKADGKFNYLAHFFKQYVKYRNHDRVPEEIEADKNRKTFQEFNKYVNENYGNGSMQDLFDSKMSDVQKILHIDNWWEEWKASKKE